MVANRNSTRSQFPVVPTSQPTTTGNTAAPMLPDMFIVLNTGATYLPPMSMVIVYAHGPPTAAQNAPAVMTRTSSKTSATANAETMNPAQRSWVAAASHCRLSRRLPVRTQIQSATTPPEKLPRNVAQIGRLVNKPASARLMDPLCCRKVVNQLV